MRFINLGVLCIALSMLLSACSSARKVISPEEENSLSGAGSILRGTDDYGKKNAEGFEQLNISELLASYKLDDLEKAANNTNSDSYRYLRNELQERIIASSNQRCMAYVKTLLSSKSQAQTGWTSLSLLLSGAAAVVPAAQTAKYLAAGSTTSTGILSTYNEAYFNNLTISVIATGIAKKRDGIHKGIVESQKLNLVSYPINAAISDALSYHGACNIVAGLEVAGQVTANADVDLFSSARSGDGKTKK